MNLLNYAYNGHIPYIDQYSHKKTVKKPLSLVKYFLTCSIDQICCICRSFFSDLTNSLHHSTSLTLSSSNAHPKYTTYFSFCLLKYSLCLHIHEYIHAYDLLMFIYVSFLIHVSPPILSHSLHNVSYFFLSY